MPVIHEQTSSSRGRCVIITGANSHLGSRAASHFAALPGWRVIALVSPRWQPGKPPTPTQGMEVIRADLTEPLGDSVQEAVRHADRVFHFAWTRGRHLARVNTMNEAMIRQLIEPLSDPSRFVFISSVAGCPGTPSGYGRAKVSAAALVRELGGNVLICGLVIEHVPRGPYKLLCSVVRKLPLSVRLFREEPQVFPICVEDLLDALVAVTVRELTPDAYKLFGPPNGFNAFVRELEQRYPKRRLPIWIPARAALGMVTWTRYWRLAPWRIADKVLSFLYKDREYLISRSDLPGTCFARWQDQPVNRG